VLCLGLLCIPLLMGLSFFEEWVTSDRRAERREEKKNRSTGRGIFVRY
jgi:hypothetical protein